MPEACLHLAMAPDGLRGASDDTPSVVLPSSGDRRDEVTAQLARISNATVCLPRFRGPFVAGEFSLDRRVASAARLVVAVDLDRVGSHGPFVLDLLARYVSPFDRARLLASPRRFETVARVNLLRRIDRIVIRRRFAQGEVWIDTGDAIAAELVCLALSEDLVPAGRAVAAPWEDDLVQRATELDLGARYAGEIRIDISDERALHHFEPVLTALHLRLGIDFSSR